MSRVARAASLLSLILVAGTVSFAETGFQAITLHFGEFWTGNAYRQPYVDVSGSEGVPIDASVGAGARFVLFDGFFSGRGALTIDPRLTIGARYYLLYQNGRVVPTQAEGSLGLDEDLLPGLGSCRVMSFAIAAPLGLELGITNRIAMTLAVSPTFLLRLRAGDADFLNERSDLNGMYVFFYQNLRWLRPEVHLATRFDLSDSFAFTIRTTSSVSIMDIVDTTLPWWDQMQAGAALEFCLTPPLSRLFETDT